MNVIINPSLRNSITRSVCRRMQRSQYNAVDPLPRGHREDRKNWPLWGGGGCNMTPFSRVQHRVKRNTHLSTNT